MLICVRRVPKKCWKAKSINWTTKFRQRKQERWKETHGWRKCSNNHALRIATARSGRPLWGLQTCCWGSRKPTLAPPDLCFCKIWSKQLSLADVLVIWPLLLLVTVAEDRISSPKAFATCLSWFMIALFRHRKFFEIALKAKETYGVAPLRPATDSKDETTICSCWW